VSVQNRSTVRSKRTIGSKSFWMHQMVLLDDEALVDTQFGPFRDSANLDVRKVHSLRRTYHRL
jgi:hypothetical protein